MNEHSHQRDLLRGHEHGERLTKVVVVITAIMMVGEIIAGLLFGSMALLADGWHMSTHVAAFGITLFAYRYARKHANDPFYKFGTGKVSVLGGFASAIALVVVALIMAVESIGRVISPVEIYFNEAIIVAVIGLLVNLGCARILHSGGHDHSHDHADSSGHHHHHDHNLKAAYLHVLADALTSIFAIVALVAGKYFGWLWPDAFMGIVGALVITKWAWGLLSETSSILLDGGHFDEKEAELIQSVQSLNETKVTGLKMWKVAPDHYAVSIRATSSVKSLKKLKSILQDFPWISHSSIEVQEMET